MALPETNRLVSRRHKLVLALALTLSCTSSPPVSAQLGFDVNQLPALLDVEQRLTDLDKRLSDAITTGRLSDTTATALKTELARIKTLEQTYKASGKFSVWQKARLLLEVDVFSRSLEASLGQTTAIGLTDVDGKIANIKMRLKEAVDSGRLTALEGQEFQNTLDGILAKQQTYKAAGALTSTQTLELALALDTLSGNFETKLKARMGDGTDFAARRAELAKRADVLFKAGKLKQSNLDLITQELARIQNREASLRASGLTTEGQLSLALDLERLSSSIESLAAASSASATATAPGIDDMQSQLLVRMNQSLSDGSLTAAQFSDLKQEFDRIAQSEAAFRAAGPLSDTNTLSLARDLNNLSSRLDTTIAAAVPQTGSLAAKRLEISNALDKYRADQRLSDSQYVGFRSELSAIADREKNYRLDGLTDSETISIASDLDRLKSKVESSLAALPDNQATATKLSQAIEAGLASGRLNANDGANFRAELSRIAQLMDAFKSGGAYGTTQNFAIAREYDALSKKLNSTLAPLPDIAGLESTIKSKLSSGKLGDAKFAESSREIARIDALISTYSADGNFDDWERMSVSRDLSKLNDDLDRFLSSQTVTGAVVTAPATAPVSNASVPVDTRGHWAESYVGELVGRSIIGGFPDGTFKPDANITRAQFAAIAVKALGLPAAAGPADFKDVSPKYWAANAIAAVSQAGLVTGFPDGTFKPEDKITRAQALVILAKALPQTIAQSGVLNPYTDSSSVPAWSLPSVSKAAQAGIIVSYPDPAQIKPNSFATRADVAALTYQALTSLGQKLPRINVGVLGNGARVQ